MKTLITAATLLARAIGCAEKRAPPRVEPLTIATCATMPVVWAELLAVKDDAVGLIR